MLVNLNVLGASYEKEREKDIESQGESCRATEQFRYILSRIAFTGRCVPQIGRRFRRLHTRDDTRPRVVASRRTIEATILCVPP